MLTQGEDVEVQALASRGWSVSAIARHLGRDRKTVRAYVRGERQAGVRASVAPDPLAPFAAYLSARFADDPHLWATALYDEVAPLGYGLSYVSFARQLRLAGLRPHCEPCAGVSGRDTIEIDHPAGEEMQWDWFERRKAPWGGTAYVLLGTLPHSGRVRGVLAESLDQPHLIEAMDAVMRRHGGTPRIWRTDRLATVIVPGSGDVQPSFAPVAKHYGVVVEPCPPRRGNRKGAVESSVRYVCGCPRGCQQILADIYLCTSNRREVALMAAKRKVDNLMALAVLATVVQQPMHRYEIASLMRARGKDQDMDVKWGSLYTVVQNLAKHGFLEVVGTSRQGARPERTVYQITEAGRQEMLDWTRELLSTPEPEHPKFAAGLSVQMILSPDEVIALLQARLGRLEESIAARRAAITEHLKEVPRLFLVEDEFAVAMVEAEAAWVRGLLEELTSGSFPGLASWRAFRDGGEMPPELVELAERGLTGD